MDLKLVSVTDLTADQAEIAASFFNLNRGFKTDAPFIDLIKYFNDLKVASAKVNSNYKNFQKSKNREEDSISNSFKWSLVSLLYLLISIEYVKELLEKWKDPSLLTICSSDAENPKCWSTQSKVSEFIKKTRKTLGEVENKIGLFYSVNQEKYAYNMDILYLDDGWVMEAAFDDLEEYIANTEGEQSLWLKPSMNQNKKELLDI